MEKYHLISRKDLDKLMDMGLVTFDKYKVEYNFRTGMPDYLCMYHGSMSQDLVKLRRSTFTTDESIYSDRHNEACYQKGKTCSWNPMTLDSKFRANWCVPCWCVVEWLEMEGIEL